MTIDLSAGQEIGDLVKATGPCALKPLCFFVSWQGVLTVAYEGFPVALTTLKQRIAEHWPALPNENPGSLWPKSTLAALKDGKRLTPAQLDTLMRLCRQFSAKHFAAHIFKDGVRLHHAALAVYSCRSLEVLLSLQRFSMEGEAAGQNVVTENEKDRVRRIVAEADDQDYWFAASKDGSRESHYRDSYGTTQGSRLLRAIAEFQEVVEESLPGLYAWLQSSSYHITLRYRGAKNKAAMHQP